MPARRAASAMFSYEPFTTLIWLSTDRTPSTLEATLSARLRSAAVAAVPHSDTLPSAAVTSMPAAWIFASRSSAFFTRAASSWFGSGFGAEEQNGCNEFFHRRPSVVREQVCDRSRVETVLVVAHLVADHHLALFGEDGFQFLAAKAAQHVLHFHLVVGAMIFDGVEAEHPHQLLREHSRKQVIGLRAACLVQRQRRGELRDPAPAFGIAAVGTR